MSIVGSEQWMYASGKEVTQQSLKFNDDESQYLSWTPSSAGNQKTWTWSGWVKRGNLGTNQSLFEVYVGGTDFFILQLSSADRLVFYYINGGIDYGKVTSAVYRDTASWFHVTFVFDSTDATSTDRMRLYVNGERVQSFSSDYGDMSLNTNGYVNAALLHKIGYRQDTGTYFDGYLSDIHFIDGQALDPTSFGQFTNGYWKKKDYAGSYGTNGFHLTFEDDVVSEGFNAVTYTGNGGTQSISGLGFEPDFVWVKSRSSGSNWHNITDSVRGAGYRIFPNETAVEQFSSTAYLTSFDSDGFSVGGSNDFNLSGGSYVAWAWDAGSGSPVSNTDGTITSTVKANPAYGFSIVSYTGNAIRGATVGHGLGAVPDIIITKSRSAVSNWFVYHSANTANPETEYLTLETANATNDLPTVWADTAPTSDVFSIGDSGWNNTSGGDYIAYCFAEVAGYSSFGSYTGTGASGNAVTGLGFKPAFLMVKRTDSTSNWAMYDNTRSTTDPRRKNVWANLSDFEYDNSAYDIDFDTNGFTLQTSDSQRNASGGTYIYMAFADTREAAFWKDVSGQGNHWTPNNLDYRDSLPDSPANNFATLNPLDAAGISSSFYLHEGNLAYSVTNNSAYRNTSSTFFPEGLKGYYEFSVTTGTPNFYVGMYPATSSPSAYLYSTTNTIALLYNGALYNGSTILISSMFSPFSTGDVGMVAFDFTGSNKYIWFGKNGSWGVDGSSNTQDPAGGNNPAYTFTTEQQLYFASNTGSGIQTIVTNFGQDSTFAGALPMGAFTDDSELGTFQYQPPAGFNSLCTANLPTPTIIDGSEHFNTVLYTGNSSTQSITGVGFQPDWLWLKNRTTSNSNALFDSVRGSGTNGFYALSSNTTNAESDGTNVTSLDSDGFTLGSNTGTNGSGNSLVSWNWKAGGTAVSNTDGSITSQVSANVDAGFSIVSYTGNGTAGATIGHGLGVQPSMIITKNRTDGTSSWCVSHTGYPTTQTLYLDSTTSVLTRDRVTARNTSTFTVGSHFEANGSGNDHIAYCFANTDTTKAGSYVGNGSSDGPFVYTGFRPAWVLIKSYTAGYDWVLDDAARSPYNEGNATLYPNASYAEYTGGLYGIDFLSNGFKVRGTLGQYNQSGGGYIYLAFAETPFKYANAR